MTRHKKKKFYVVWSGRRPGVYRTWEECDSVINGYPNAKYMAFTTIDDATSAFNEGPARHWGNEYRQIALPDAERFATAPPIANSLCVDAAWNTETKMMEYRGVWHHDRSVAFHQGPFQKATNNLGEFLAIVHGLALMAKQSLDWPVYSDSHTAITWVRNQRVKSLSMQKGETSPEMNSLVNRALNWLSTNDYPNEILKWDTTAWGEIPADYGRK